MAAKPRLVENIKEPTNGGKNAIKHSEPYTVRVTLTGMADYLFHRFNEEAVEEKAKAAKNSAAKKTDDVESYVWRNEKGELCIPGEHMRGTIIAAAKFQQDPRSPRKSAMDLYKAGVIVTTVLAPLGTKDWDYLHKGRVKVQQSAIIRIRPAMRAGYTAMFDISVILPEYIDRNTLLSVIGNAGKLCGIGDYRPTFGRFSVTGYETLF
jgi:hypothetical protein